MHGPAPRRPHASVDTALRDLGSRQHGLVDITSVLALGIHRNSIDRRVAEGLLVRCYRGIYRFASAVPTATQRIAAARLAAGPSAVAVGRSAAVLHGLNVAFALDIGVAPGLTRSLPGITIHRRRMDAVELTTVHAIPATTLARTVFDLTTIIPADPMAGVVDEVLARRMIGRDVLLRATDLRAGHVGAPRIRQLLDDRPRGALHRSRAERRVAAILRAAGLGDGQPNLPIVDADGNDRLLDVAWPAERVALELDIFRWHTGRTAWANDRYRANAVTAAGWRSVSATDADLDDRLRRPIGALRLLLNR